MRRVAVLLALALLVSGCTWPLAARVVERAPGVYDVRFPVAREADPLGEWVPTPEIYPTATPMPIPACTGTVTAQPRLNVRDAPNGAWLGVVEYGEVVAVLDRDEDWLAIAPSGWVWSAYIALGDGCAEYK